MPCYRAEVTFIRILFRLKTETHLCTGTSYLVYKGLWYLRAVRSVEVIKLTVTTVHAQFFGAEVLGVI